MPDKCAYCEQPAPFSIVEVTEATDGQSPEEYSVCKDCLEILSGVKQ